MNNIIVSQLGGTCKYGVMFVSTFGMVRYIGFLTGYLRIYSTVDIYINPSAVDPIMVDITVLTERVNIHYNCTH